LDWNTYSSVSTITCMENQNELALEWLEDVSQSKTQMWLAQQRTAAMFLQTEVFRERVGRLRELAETKTPNRAYVIGEYYYQIFTWLIRRTSLASMIASEPKWDTIVNVEDLELACPGFERITDLQAYDHRGERFLLTLVHRNKASQAYREFVLSSEDGSAMFNSSTCCGNACWLDESTIFYTPEREGAVDYREVRAWRRGGEEEPDKLILKAAENRSVSLTGFSTPEARWVLMTEEGDWGNCAYHFHSLGREHTIELPLRTVVWGWHMNTLLMSMGEKCRISGFSVAEGSLVALDFEALLMGERKGDILWHPTPRSAVQDVVFTERAAIVNIMEDAQCRLFAYEKQNRGWSKARVLEHEGGRIELRDPGASGPGFLCLQQDFLQPATLRYYSEGFEVETLEVGGNWFKEDDFRVEQCWAQSDDGTQIPYSVVGPKQGFGQEPKPTLLEAYGGFGISSLPRYLFYQGPLWLEKGGLYVLANLRGGGEFGPSWHWDATKENRDRIYQDHEAVARDLVARGLTSPKLLGLYGMSNGGLVAAAAITRNPELFGAAVMESAITDMRRYHHFTRGEHDWRNEYGVWDPQMATPYSPLHELREDASYPPILICGGQEDDVVHVSHGRKFARRLHELGHEYLLFEQPDYGHGKGEWNKYTSLQTLMLTFLVNHLISPARKRKQHVCNECEERFHHGIGLRKHQRQTQHKGSRIVERESRTRMNERVSRVTTTKHHNQAVLTML
jgi:prolyl oligopeptidase